MSASIYLAHRAEDGRTETVLQHSQETAQLSAQFSSAFGAESQGFLAGLAHDIGKYSAAFQRRIRGDPKPVDHSTAGAVECAHMDQPFAALAVAGHHSGLPDFGNFKEDKPDAPTLCGKIRRAQKGLLESYEHWSEELSLPEASKPSFFRSRMDIMFFTRMLYSCLVDADFLCTESFMEGHRREADTSSVEDLEARLERYIKDWYPPQTELNALRCEILTRCRQQGNLQKPGLFTLTVPTGGGKTIASLAFALAHARQHNLHRIIYVIPYTSIIEQNAAVFREILGDDAVLEHHSGVLYDLKQEAEPATIRMAQATENWDMPVIVTTAVQFFESLFANRSSKCRKLHNLANSVIIFDEAQMLPLPYLRPCVYAIAQLVQHYGVSAVLCTATQPALEPLFREFMPGQTAVELCPSKIFQNPIFRRVTFQKAGKLNWEQLAEKLQKEKQVLCIVNSRKSAQMIYSHLTGEGCYHLSTLMIPAHREQVLKEIRQRLNGGLPCRVVSTSLIEAGVDVDFPVVYREEIGLDSILQAAGRCNREGKRSASESIVTVFQLDGKPLELFSAPIGAGHAVINRYENIASQEAVTAYFRELLDLKGASAQDQKGIMDLMNEKRMPFREIAEEFHLIDNATRAVYVPIGEGAELVKRLKNGEYSRTLFRQLGRYGISVYENQFQALMNAGALELLEDGSAILSDLTLYDQALGLTQNIEK